MAETWRARPRAGETHTQEAAMPTPVIMPNTAALTATNAAMMSAATAASHARCDRAADAVLHGTATAEERQDHAACNAPVTDGAFAVLVIVVAGLALGVGAGWLAGR